MKQIYIVDGMNCVICKNTVEKSLNNLNGVHEAHVNLLDNEVYIDYDDSLSFDDLKNAISKDGYILKIKKKETNTSLYILIISILLSISEMILMYIIKPNNINLILSILSLIVIIININIIKSGIKAIINLNPNMNTLVTISSLVSYIYSIFILIKDNTLMSYFDVSCMILSIVSIGKYIESLTKHKATSILRGLTTLIPMYANLIDDNHNIKQIPISELKKGNKVLVNKGESFPQDGIIIKGSCSINESLITGESLPVTKTINDNVIGGSINIDGQVEVLINSVSSTTILSNIISLTKKSLMNKIKIERITDIISKYFITVVLLISIITFIIWYLLSKDISLSMRFAISVLMVSCPCALGLATPCAIYVASSLSSKNGILIKNTEILEIAYKTKYIIFDKTGTLTYNKLHIEDMIKYDDSFIDILCSLESYSNHPISNTIKEAYKYNNIQFDKVENIENKGLKAILNNDIYMVSNIQYLAQNGVIIKNIDEYKGLCIGASMNNKLLGIVILSDVIKEEAKLAINNIKNKNIYTILCTGDNEHEADKLNKQVNLDKVIYNASPSIKNDVLNKYKKEGKTMMIGDGVNDAIALSNADVSVSIKEASDIANASADVILLNNDLNNINFLIDLSNKTMKIIKQNLFWALFYNSISIPLACGLLYNKFGIALSPILSAITMSFSSIFVISNALRINNVKKENK